jgi:hypothetical protein
MKQLIEWIVKYTREWVEKLKLIIKKIKNKMKQLIEWIVKYTREWVEKLKLIIKKINKK